MRSKYAGGGDLCLRCGMCCDGTIFADVKLRRGDARPSPVLGAPRLAPASSAGASRRWSSGDRLPQPCPALGADCRCAIYDERPRHCRDFECLVLRQHLAGQLRQGAALRLIAQARRTAEVIKEGLRALGDTDEHLALKTRFQQTERRFQKIGWDRRAAAAFSDLTLAMHRLNVQLSETFYPG